MNKPHEVIYLTQEDEADEDSWLWCQDSVGDNDIKYVLARSQDKNAILDEAIAAIKDIHPHASISNTATSMQEAILEAIENLKGEQK